MHACMRACVHVCVSVCSHVVHAELLHVCSSVDQCVCVLLHVPSHPHLLPPPLQAEYGGDCVCYITEDRPAAELAAALCYT